MPTQSASSHIRVLDGWRAISILLVLACHLLPLGPKAWELNEAAGPMGMALFFVLSGFLMTRFLAAHGNVRVFLARRVLRILPLAWLGLFISLPFIAPSPATWLLNLAFLANIPPIHLTELNAHYWSLCVEFQFYFLIALLYAVFGKKGLLVIPFACVAVTLHRIYMHAYVDIVTWRRIDEIFTGCMLALIYDHAIFSKLKSSASKYNSYLTLPLFILLMVSSHPRAGWMNYLRPYFAATLVGTTLLTPAAAIKRILESKTFSYIANISFALYVIHPLLAHTSLGTADDKVVKYAKRAVLIALTFIASHASTKYFESRFIQLGRRL